MPEADGLQPYLRELRLKNFKSVRNQRIPLFGLTLVIGSNSSGKSNLVRGLLALTQTVESRSPTLGFLLNGHRINLGSFTEVLSQGSVSGAVSVGVTVCGELSSWGAGPYYYPPDEDLPEGPYLVEFDATFSGTDTADPIYSPVSALSFGIRASSSPTTSYLSLKIPKKSPQRISGAEVLWRDWYFPPPQRIATSIRGSWKSGSQTTIKVAGADIRGLVPLAVVERRDASEAYADAWVDALDQILTSGVPRRRKKASPAASLDLAVSLACESISAWLDGERDTPWLHYVYEQLNDAGLLRRDVAPPDSAALRSLIAERLPKGRMEYVGPGGRDSRMLRQAATALAPQLNRKVHYLGGLRAAPSPVYQPSPQVQAGEIGDEGQFVAAALHTLREQLVDMPVDETGRSERRRLRDAVDYWAKRLDLFEGVTPHHMGSLGLDIRVTQTGLTDPLDITSVGLGVSQLLPVIVRCLLADPGEVVILEQPELHLHPASQQRLADFLLACALSGRQMVVETHSEHLINRIRLRAAQENSQGAPIASTVGLLLAERDHDSGETTYRSSNLNRFGGLDTWPAGFLDSGIADAQQLLEAGLDKKRREAVQ